MSEAAFPGFDLDKIGIRCIACQRAMDEREWSTYFGDRQMIMFAPGSRLEWRCGCAGARELLLVDAS